MRRFIIGFLAVIGTLTLIVFSLFVWSFHHLAVPSLPSIGSENSLVLNLKLGDHALPEQPDAGGIRAFVEGRPLSLQTLMETLEYAAKDQAVKGILLTLEDDASLGTAVTQEIRDAFKKFKTSGKFIYTYADTFGELSNGTLPYYLATATTQIWMLPLGSLNFTGFMLEIPFTKKALENLKLNPQIGRREEYKGFSETFTESDFTAPHKANMQQVLDIQVSYIIDNIAEDRGLQSAEIRNLMDNAPHLPQKAVEAKLIDKIGYKDEIKDAIEALIGTKPVYVPFEDYAQRKDLFSKGEKIAVIYAEGLIGKGKSGWSPLSGDRALDATEIAKNIREAVKDDAIKAIILRINSSGGTPIASELIGREVELAKAKKPIIASLSNYGASGGYLIACSATKIVAQPGTITGSIGVAGGKVVTQEFWDNLGVHWGEIHNGNHAALWSTDQAYSEQGWQKFNAYIDQIYDMFLDRVAKGRKLSPEQVRQIAKGRIWTGLEAKEKGLVDVLGGMTTAIEVAKKEANLSAQTHINLVHLPLSPSFMDFVLNRKSNEETYMLARYPALRAVLSQLDHLLAKPQIHAKMEEIQLPPNP